MARYEQALLEEELKNKVAAESLLAKIEPKVYEYGFFRR